LNPFPHPVTNFQLTSINGKYGMFILPAAKKPGIAEKGVKRAKARTF
jgi:hypothetical protein